MSDTSFGQWVRTRRKQRRLTQKALGNLIGYAEVTVRQVESETYSLTPFMVERIVSVLSAASDDQPSILRFALQQQSLSPKTPIVGIPRTVTAFIGRERELEQIQTLLNNPDCALISIVGIGGIGKTRLALQAINRFNASTSYEVCFVDLMGISTGSFAQAIANAASIPLNPFVPPIEQISQALAGRKVLLLLDNMEHLLTEGVPMVNTLLQKALHTKLLVTSRERLRIASEWCIRLDGFSLSEQTETLEAVQLFVNTAQRINLQFSVPELELIREICRLVYGIPLAIEMAASWTEVYSCQEILTMIQQQQLDLGTAQRDIGDRHKSLRAVFEATWVNLSDEEQIVLKRLSVMRGEFATDAAIKVSGVTHNMLAYLQDKMLIQPQHDGHISLHEMIRQLAYEKLEANAAELQHANIAHAEYYLKVWGDHTDGLKYYHSQATFIFLAPLMENLRQAWRTMIEYRRVDWFWMCYQAVWLYYNATNRHGEGAQLFTFAMEALAGEDATDDEIRVRVIARLFSGLSMMRQGRIPEMVDRFVSPDIVRVRESQDHTLLFWLSTYESFLYYALGDAPAAREAGYSANRYLKRFNGDSHLQASAHFQIGRAEHLSGNLDKAVEYLTETIRICRHSNIQWGVSVAVTELGMVVEAQEDLTAALDYYNQSLAYTVVVNDWWNYQRARTNVSRIQVTLGNYAEAITLTLAILQNLLVNPSYGLEIECFIVVARIFKHTGDNATAIALLRYCATHLECDQITRDRAKAYLEAFDASQTDTTFASVMLPATKVEVTALLIERLAQLQTAGVPMLAAEG